MEEFDGEKVVADMLAEKLATRVDDKVGGSLCFYEARRAAFL